MVKKILIAAGVLFLIGAGVVWYLFTDTHKDTATIAAAYTLQATDFIKEFEANLPAANKKYTEKIISITGKLTEKQSTDSTINLIITDTTKGSYINFSFQQKDMAVANSTKVGDNLTIKGSCSGGEFSEILETHYINFNRCTLNK